MIGGLIGVFVGMLGGLAAAYAMARLRAQTARGLAEQILANARREAETIRMQADLQSKQELLSRRDELDLEAEETRKDLRDQERRIEKRGDLLDQKLELINRKDREFESIQRYLAEQQDELQQRQLEVKQTQAEQRELLQKIGRLAPEEARTILLKRVRGRAARTRSARLIMQARGLASRKLPAEGARDPDHDHPALCRVAHRGGHGQHGRYSQRRDEGSDHRPRGAEYPRVRESDRRGCDRR